ncbi:hypothetical protein [Micromonospora sp. CA-246542]
MAVHGPRNAVDRVLRGAEMHPRPMVADEGVRH